MDANDNITFSINQVAKIIGVSTSTIRNWEKNGIISPARSQSNYRTFTIQDIGQLQKIKSYSVDMHMGTQAIKLLLGTQSQGGDLEKTINDQKKMVVSKKMMSKKWRLARKAQGYTLEEVSRAVGISTAHLSKLENGGSISLSMMSKLARFYKESPLDFLEPSREESNVVRKGVGEPLDLGGDPGVVLCSLSALHEHVMYPVLCTVQPGSGNQTPHTHNGEEFIYMLGGTLEINLNDEPPCIIHTGDAFYYRGSDRHTWWNPAKKPARFIWVHSSLSR